MTKILETNVDLNSELTYVETVVGSNGDFSDISSKKFFIQKNLYDRDSFDNANAYAPDAINLFENGNILYGRVDNQNNSIAIKKPYLKRLDLESDEKLFCVDFVADAFSQLKREIKRETFAGNMIPYGAYAECDPVKAWISPIKSYENAVEEMVRLYFETYIVDLELSGVLDLKINTFKEYVLNFINFFSKRKNSSFVSLTHFIRSVFCSPLSSGLILELSDDDHNDDKAKFDKYLTDPNFTTFSRLALKHGFRIDKNAPWRLIADLNSEAMKKQLTDRKINSLTQFFEEYYYQTYLADLQVMRDVMYKSYDEYSSRFPYYKVSVKEYRLRERLSKEQKADNGEYGVSYFIDLYAHLRMLEASGEVNLNIPKILEKIKNAKKVLDIPTIMRYINGITKACPRSGRQTRSRSTGTTTPSRGTSGGGY